MNEQISPELDRAITDELEAGTPAVEAPKEVKADIDAAEASPA